MDEMTTLSLRVAADLPTRIAVIANQRGQPVEQVVDDLLRAFLKAAERPAAALADIVPRLRALEPALRERSVSDLWVFGSVARGEASRDTDVDVAIEFAPGSRRSLLDIVHVKDMLEAALGHRVDIAMRSAMKPVVARSATDDMVRVY